MALICSAWGSSNRTYPAADQALFTSACIAECMPCKLLLPFIAYLLPLDSQQQTINQGVPHPHTRAGGASPAPHRISRLQATFLL
eukprot:1158050-Pelagomonas_calceolata.AAC.2